METKLEKEEPIYSIFSVNTDTSFAKLDVDNLSNIEKLVLSVQGFQTEVWHINYIW